MMSDSILETPASKKIMGMPVYSCQEGLYLGNIRTMLLDAKNYLVQGFLVERRRAAREDRILPLGAVRSFGKDGITVNSVADMERIGQSSKYIRAIRHPLIIIGSRVFTTAGRTLGKVEDYRFNTETGLISGFEISPDGFFKEKTLVHGKYLIAISGRTIMLQEEAASDVIGLGSGFIGNMGNAASSVKEKAGEIMANTAQITKKVSANLNEKMGKFIKGEDTDTNSDTDEDMKECGEAGMENMPEAGIPEKASDESDNESCLQDKADSPAADISAADMPKEAMAEGSQEKSAATDNNGAENMAEHIK